MSAGLLRERTKKFAIDVIRLTTPLPRYRATDVIVNQLLRSSTSVGANYRAAHRARSPADFIAKMSIVEEEADESVYWLELLVDAGIVKLEAVTELIDEGNQLVAMTVASINTARQRRK